MLPRVLNRSSASARSAKREAARRPPRRGWLRLVVLATTLGGVYVIGHGIADELRTSRLQARYLSRLGRDIRFEVQPGASDSIRFPDPSPYDTRLGYALLPGISKRLAARGYAPVAQARMSDDMLRAIDYGLFAPYPEKDQAGLSLLDCNGLTLAAQHYPQRQYAGFAAVPTVMVNALLFVENQGLLNPEFPERNPALDWVRFSHAIADQGLRLALRHHDSPGGSTLATQIEKYRHSPEGRTVSVREKFRQMASASLRAYLEGPDTQAARERVVVDYLNTVPLAARAGFGEVNGIGDGLWVWYGEDFAEANRLLTGMDPVHPTPREAQVFKRALSLIIAQRRPTFHLRRDDTNLDALTGSYLRLLAANGSITPALRDAALAQPLDKAAPPPRPPQPPYVTRKAENQLRADLSHLTGIPSRYELDRLDLRATSSVNREAQRDISAVLQRLHDPAGAREMGLYGYNMLRPGDDPGKLVASFTLYERVGNASLLRVQADNVDQPFDLNSGARLNLGSTAKLRTLVTYLEIVTELQARYADMSRAELQAARLARNDVLSRWAVDYMLKTREVDERALEPMLEAALERKYSGNPGEAFFTGGGMQSFSNFERWEGERIMTVRQGFQHSVNLVFIRLMRDIVRYEVAQAHPDVDRLMEDRAAPERRGYLERFADIEGSAYMAGFYRRYRHLDQPHRISALLDRVRTPPSHLGAVHLAVALLSVEPSLDEAGFARVLRARLPALKLSDEDIDKLYQKYGHDKFNLNDRGYLSRIHPLELWLVEYLAGHPDATLEQVLRDSRAQRQEVYRWLFRTHSKFGQDNRIRTLLEQDAFVRIAQRWHRLGYPFDALTPSYATAIGASGDRPAALAELAGILLGGGLAVRTAALTRLDFAEGTPYATQFALQAPTPQRLLPPEVAALVRRSMTEVVQGGTASSIRDAFTVAGQPPSAQLAVGGKTGTGDQHYQVGGPGGRVVASYAVSRSATFVFVLGERYFGTVTLFVKGQDASHYNFTSALAVRLLRSLAPQLTAMAGSMGTERALLRCPRE